MYAEFAQSYIAQPKMVLWLLRIDVGEGIARTLPARWRPEPGELPVILKGGTSEICSDGSPS